MTKIFIVFQKYLKRRESMHWSLLVIIIHCLAIIATSKADRDSNQFHSHNIKVLKGGLPWWHSG